MAKDRSGERAMFAKIKPYQIYSKCVVDVCEARDTKTSANGLGGPRSRASPLSSVTLNSRQTQT